VRRSPALASPDPDQSSSLPQNMAIAVSAGTETTRPATSPTITKAVVTDKISDLSFQGIDLLHSPRLSCLSESMSSM
jgi:hypothetical protein